MINNWYPHAVIVFDKFHIIAKFNNTIDQVHRDEQSRNNLSKQETLTLKHNRWILVKTKEF
ncbi:MAG: transposase [Halanaerobiales bacterium]|nr:transposase [Halanaerobiales bacterium]